MQKLVKGILRSASFFASHRALSNNRNDRPTAETLFITCFRQRVVPNLITNAAPASCSSYATWAKRRPHHGLPGGTAAAIQYSVEVLNVENVIVMRATQCGALKAILDPESVAHLEFVRRLGQEHDRREELDRRKSTPT